MGVPNLFGRAGKAVPFLCLPSASIMSVETLYKSENPAVKPSRTSTFFNGLITLLWWFGWAFLALMVFAFVFSMLAYFNIGPLKSQYFADLSPLSGMGMAASAAIGAIAFLIILKQLRLICATLVSGDPFVPENAGRLRVVWITMALAEILRLISNTWLSSLHKTGEKLVEGVDKIMTIDLRLYIWFSVLVLMVLAEVFREGARLRQEQKLTV